MRTFTYLLWSVYNVEDIRSYKTCFILLGSVFSICGGWVYTQNGGWQLVPNAKCLECLVRGSDSRHCSSLVAVGRIVDDDPRR